MCRARMYMYVQLRLPIRSKLCIGRSLGPIHVWPLHLGGPHLHQLQRQLQLHFAVCLPPGAARWRALDERFHESDSGWVDRAECEFVKLTACTSSPRASCLIMVMDDFG